MSYVDEIAAAIRARLDPGTLARSDSDRRFRIPAVLALIKGTVDVHDAWAAWESDRKPESPSIIPIDQLRPEVQRLDEPFVKAVRQAGQERLRITRCRDRFLSPSPEGQHPASSARLPLPRETS